MSQHWAIDILTTKDCDLISISTKWHPFLQPYVSHIFQIFPSVDVVLSVLMLMLCCSDFTWVQCDRHLVRSWTDNLRRKNLKKKSFSRWVLDKSSFVYNWDFPPWHEAAWWLRWWWPNHGLCHQDHGGKWGWPEEKEHCNTRDHDWSICLWNRVLGRGRDDNGIWHFCLSWCLLCELKYKRFGAEIGEKLVEDEMIGIMGFR